MNKTPEQIEIDILKSQVDNQEHRIRFLEQNWIHWTKDTQETGQKLLVALNALGRT